MAMGIERYPTQPQADRARSVSASAVATVRSWEGPKVSLGHKAEIRDSAADSRPHSSVCEYLDAFWPFALRTVANKYKRR